MQAKTYDGGGKWYSLDIDYKAVSAMLRWNVEMREYLKANKLD